MALSRLQVTDFRCLQSAEFQPDSTLHADQRTQCFGQDQSARGHLCSGSRPLVSNAAAGTSHPAWRPSDSWFSPKLIPQPGVCPWALKDREVGSARRSTVISPPPWPNSRLFLPVQIIDPEVHHLIEEGPSRRRRFLDWGVFHVEQSFVSHWQRYQQVLKQRNAALKAHQPRAWSRCGTAILCAPANHLSAARARYVSLLSPCAEAIGRNLLGMELSLSYRNGWPEGQSLSEALELSWSHDLEMGATQVGPHRAELSIRLDGSRSRIESPAANRSCSRRLC